MSHESLLAMLREAADAVGSALEGVTDWGPSGLRHSQYAADVVADDAVLAVLSIDPSTITLKLGMKHATVATAQTALARVLKVKVKVDGVYGPGTVRLVKRFQKTVGLKQSGVINHETWMALLSASSQQ